MCGFATCFSTDLTAHVGAEEAATVGIMLDRLAHRGPDGRGLETLEGRVVMGHVRLSLLDLSVAAAQPMTDSTGRYLLAYNGEVYNYRELAEELKLTKIDEIGDTAVVLEACIRWGVVEACRRFEGMFALAFHDRDEGRLFLARDVFGIKPAFYHQRDGRVWAASELKAFEPVVGAAHPEFSSVMAMLLGAPHLGPASPWPGVGEVAPGSVVEFKSGSDQAKMVVFDAIDQWVSEDRYGEISAMTVADYDKEFARLFGRAVSRTTVSDTPIGVGLSGGLDSSAVLGAMAGGTEPVAAFHADVRGHESERQYAEQAATAMEAQLRVAETTPQDFVGSLAELTYANDYPLGYHPNSIPFQAMAGATSDAGVKAILTGEGADELLGGYGWVGDRLFLKRARRPFDLLFRSFQRIGWDRGAHAIQLLAPSSRAGGSDASSRLRDLGNAQQDQQWRDRAERAYGFLPPGEEREFAEAFMHTCFGHLQSLLWRNDRMGMWSGIESRFPFLDRELAAFLLNSPRRLRGPQKSSKATLRRTAVDLGVPKAIAEREKFAFSANPSHFCPVDPSYFSGGYLESVLPGIVGERRGADWDNFYFYLVATETWGRIFAGGESLSSVRDALSESVKS